MRVVDAAATRTALPFERLVPALRAAFIEGAEVPLRHRHAIPVALGATDRGDGGTLLLMPAWRGRAALGVKVVTVFPGNGARGLNAVSSTYLLCDGETGQHVALIDGNELTARRTAAASALAGSYLARGDAHRLLIVGSGHVASVMAPAWRAVRPIAQVAVWNVRPGGAARLAARLQAEGFAAGAVEDLAAAVADADIVSCATLAEQPLLHGEWLRPGTHVDLVGGYLPTMREADDAVIARAKTWIDTEAALSEAGDLTQPLQAGVLTRQMIVGTLADLCHGSARGRADDGEITLFKSVGSAIEDLAAAMLVWSE